MKEVVPNKVKSRLIDKIRHKVWITIDKFKMFTEDDNILVGVSGGKDSLILLEALAYLKIVHKPDLKITAIHINIKNVPYELDRDYFDSFCKELNIPYIIKDIDIDFDPNHKKGACFVC
jgi:tRNA(Ile)-lysidine synthase TilS/MesJ